MTEPAEFRLDEVLAAARGLTREEIDQGWAATLGAHPDIVRLIDSLTTGREPFPAFIVGVLVGRRLANGGPGPDGPYVPLDA